MIDFRSGREPKSSSFDYIQIRIASPEEIRGPRDSKERERHELQGQRTWWSWGEVTKPETINYRSFKPERDGLFCERIFGPVKDWECHCGKYKRIRYRGVICDRCGVEVTLSKVRRERMGHIELAVPVAHIWFFKTLPSPMGNLLDMTLRDLERVIYYTNYVVIEPGEQEVQEKELLDEDRFLELRAKAKAEGDAAFKADIGAPAVRSLLERLNVDKLADELREAVAGETSQHRKKQQLKRLKIVDAFRNSGNAGEGRNDPRWMILDVVPVIPPDLRPLVPLDGGRFATSDLNDLYRRVINRNNRLQKLILHRAPEVILRNEKRMLQEAVDALFDNGRRSKAIRGRGKRPLKSLSDMLKGKQGRFRQNLLGKRVDYSGRSVIVVGPELRLHQCGLPKAMAVELFKPFIIHKLVEKGIAETVKRAKKIVEKESTEVFEILEEIIQDHPVLLNRAPTLHRLGIQAFEPVLVEGKAIRIHPLVCAAFNADFDGDQMAVHVPLSFESQIECRLLMISSNNVLKPSDGRPVAEPSQDMVLGCYFLTKEPADFEQAEVKAKAGRVGSVAELDMGLATKRLAYHSPVHFWDETGWVYTTAGRVIFHSILPEGIRREGFLNQVMRKRDLSELVFNSYRRAGLASTVQFLDNLKEFGFRYATMGGVSIGVEDLEIPAEKSSLLHDAEGRVERFQRAYATGQITFGERYNKVIDAWTHANNDIADAMVKTMQRSKGGFNPVFMMFDSGSRGSRDQIRQLAGMRGLMAKPQKKLTGGIGEVIESPIKSNFREGLTVLEYFISTHGARKGLADTALKTADAGYLTRRLVDVAQDVIINEYDCGTTDGIFVEPIIEAGVEVEPLRDRVVGRVSLDKIKDFEGNVIVDVNQEINEELANAIQAAGIDRVRIRSVLTCESRRGVCALCYGRNLATGRMVELGEAVGVIAAQSIGEPGTQLTMRTFHIGGTATRVSERSTLEVRNNGIIKFVDLKYVQGRGGAPIAMNRSGLIAIVDEKGREKERYHVVYGARLRVQDGEHVTHGQILAEWDPFTFSILTETAGTVKFDDLKTGITIEEQVDEVTGLSQDVVTLPPGDEKHQPAILIRDSSGKVRKKYLMPSRAHLMVRDGDDVQAGDVLAKIPRETTKTKDITGGLPRVVELFETRKPKDPAVISEIDGSVRYGEIAKGMRKIHVESEDGKTTKEYAIPRGVHINVQEGDHVKAGEALIDGPLNLHDLLAVLGEKFTQAYLVNAIQEVYRLQGVNINDKHIETISRQMMRWVKVEDVGDTNFLLEEQVDKFRFREENDEAIKRGGRPATGRPLLLGITKASLSTDSFISAASFQETTRVLTEAAVAGKVDYLRGLKENVIMGRLIPAGTGLEYYRNVRLSPEMEEAAAKVQEEVSQAYEEAERALELMRTEGETEELTAE